ncbi:ribosomal protection-like ABC-F family protein [Alkalicoccus luteus]|uniref:ABC-F family ATP-binding cassette domain-containing protein n=1 Tax=Alkalicoccus luteus TaxID=1237094 RepID=A0A969TV82_9BACI|nr:ATP-binding cassette domain-containing protein [Alkalicoccus luteus]NJP37716.1 ABC-F family ATP-binding cassette domain-containing protein [Alkalicoccus luteus]
MMLYAEQLSAEVNGKELFTKQTLTVEDGDRIGLIGANGSGKSTLLEILAGRREPDSGSCKADSTVIYLPQLKESEMKSGGEITQAWIQQAFAEQGGLLLADEPTTSLDEAHIQWLEEKLQRWKGAYIVVSHDREFLDRTCTSIWAMEQKLIKTFPGSYYQYREQKHREEREHQQAYNSYVKQKRSLEEAARRREERADQLTSTKNVSRSEASITGAKPYFAKKQKKMQQTAKAMEKRLEQLEQVDKPWEDKPLKMTLPGGKGRHHQEELFVKRMLAKAHERHLWTAEPFPIRHGEKLSLTGHNGSGKTTFLKKLQHGKGVAKAGWSRLGFFQQDLTMLHPEETVLENAGQDAVQPAEVVRTILARLGFRGSDINKRAAVLSGGERVKLSLAMLMTGNYTGLVLDEPTSFLDVEAAEALESLLVDYPGTLIVVSHDRRFRSRTTESEIRIDAGRLWRTDMQATVQTEEEEERMRIDTRLAEVIGRLSLEPDAALESEYQELLKKKQAYAAKE